MRTNRQWHPASNPPDPAPAPAKPKTSAEQALDVALTITYAGEAWEAWLQALQYPIEHNYTARLTFSNGEQCEAQLEPLMKPIDSLDDNTANAVFRYRRSVLVDGEPYLRHCSEVAYVYSTTQPYIIAVHVW